MMSSPRRAILMQLNFYMETEMTNEEELKKLRRFAQEMLSDHAWTFGLTPSEICDIASKYELIEAWTPREPCGDRCLCATVNDLSQFMDGNVYCHRLIDNISAA